MARRQSASQEAREVAADLAAQELGPNDGRVHVLSPAYVHAVNPDTALEVVFLPGEALPAWAVDGLAAAEVVSDNPPVVRLP